MITKLNEYTANLQLKIMIHIIYLKFHQNIEPGN